MTFFDSLPTVTEVVSSTAPQATAMFNALSPVLWFGLGVVVAVVTISIVFGAIRYAINYLNVNTFSQDGYVPKSERHIVNMSGPNSYDEWARRERERGYNTQG